MLSRADSIGVFQVESRAQMTMLPRLKPREFYDLVIEVRSCGPGRSRATWSTPICAAAPARSRSSTPRRNWNGAEEGRLGAIVPGTGMQIAIVGAGFPPDEADRLRRAMATFKRNGEIHLFRDRFIAGMWRTATTMISRPAASDRSRGSAPTAFRKAMPRALALLVYVSAWIKCFHPDVFACALLNSQPMGFYAPAQIVRDAATTASRCAG